MLQPASGIFRRRTKAPRYLLSLLSALLILSSAHAQIPGMVSADDTTRVQRTGDWRWTAHRYAASSALVTSSEGAALEFSYRGHGLVLCLDTLTPPNHYGPPELGVLEIQIDGVRVRDVRPRIEDREVVLVRSREAEAHRVRVIHRHDETGTGCRINGFRVLTAPSGDLSFVISGEQQGALRDVRAILTREGEVVREVLLRNGLTGQGRLAGIPPGKNYSLSLSASGWKTWRRGDIVVRPGEEAVLPPVFLKREWDIPLDSFKFPTFGHPVVRRPGESLRMRFEAHRDEIGAVRLVRREGPAIISQVGTFSEDPSAAFYYHREGTLTLPPTLSPGLYDLEVTVTGKNGSEILSSRRCVNVVREFPRNPVFMTFGHLDTWGQYQAEYLARLVQLANLIAPDMVLISDEVNPAYVAGALYDLKVPFVVNFGNHREPEPTPWFGEPIGIVDFGPRLSVLNFGRPWDTGLADADALLSSRENVPCKVINAFEANAPVATFLDRHKIAVIHYAHGPGPAIAKLGATPSIRVGKSNSSSFRLVRFQAGRPVSYTYRGHATAPIPFPREAPPPARLTYQPANDGTHATVTANFENELDEDLLAARITFVLPRGKYRAEAGRIESAVDSDEGRFTVLRVRFEMPAGAKGQVRVMPVVTP